MDNLEIRTAVSQDAPALRDIFRRSSLNNEGDRALFTEHPELLDWADTPLREQRTRVALIDGRIVGFATLVPAGEVAELEDLFVDPDAMRTGVGRALTDDAAELARAQGMAALEVDANPHAKVFYVRAGFQDQGITPVTYGTGFRMRRPL